MPPDPRAIAADLGLDITALVRAEILSERHGHAIWRLATPERSYVLKWLPDEAARVEVEAYALLRALGVPTLPLYACTNQALLLEDLAHSRQWRLATEADIAREEVGQAVAHWYRIFHRAGEALLMQKNQPGFLRRETDILTPASLLAAGQLLKLEKYPVWELAASQIDLLKAALEKMSLTLNYNDFHWTNLALSREETEPVEAIVFDYHLLGIGMRYSDCRNVSGSLAGEAVKAFWEAYGTLDPREAIFDRPLADLYGLQVASQMPQFPRWAEACRERVQTGELEKDLRAAVNLVEDLP